MIRDIEKVGDSSDYGVREVVCSHPSGCTEKGTYTMMRATLGYGGQDIAIQYFENEKCGHKYLIFCVDAKVRLIQEAFNKLQERQGKLQASGDSSGFYHVTKKIQAKHIHLKKVVRELASVLEGVGVFGEEWVVAML